MRSAFFPTVVALPELPFHVETFYIDRRPESDLDHCSVLHDGGCSMTDTPDILIVDDQPDNLRLLSSILSQQGYKVRKATNGAAAIAAVDAIGPDLILLDITMPGLSGYDVCQQLKAAAHTQQIPIIFLSALDDAADKVRAFQVGGADYITKPFEVEEVMARISHQLTIQRQRQQLQQEVRNHQQTAEILRQSRAMLSSVLNSSIDGVAAFQAVRDDHGKIHDFQWVVANPVAARWAGKPRESLIGQSVVDELPEPNKQELFDWFVEVVETGCSLEREVCYPRRGQSIWFQLVATKLGDGFSLTFRDITPVKTMVIQLEATNQELEHRNQELQERVNVCDIMLTERLEAENALQQVEERYRSIFEHSIEGIYQLAPDRSYLGVNPAYAKILGYDSPDEFLAVVRSPQEVYVQPKRQAELTAYMQRYDSVPDFESQVYRKDRSVIWMSENIWAVRDGDGILRYYEGMITDITDRKEAERELRVQRLRSERLLLNILPQRIAERLKRSPRTIADSFAEVTVLFADLVNFTQLANQISPQELVELLNQIFSTFDGLVETYGLEKVKTIGDEYMAVSGMPSPRPDHAGAIAELALDMQEAIAQFKTPRGDSFRLRIGINTGPVVAGVIGTKKFSYDLWGDTVNVASRMESRGEPGRIQVTEKIYELLKSRYTFENRGEIFIKGIGQMQTYWLTGRQPI
jgi:adenylate cyclase